MLQRLTSGLYSMVGFAHSLFKFAPTAFVLKCPLMDPSGLILGTTKNTACFSAREAKALWGSVISFRKPCMNHSAIDSPGCCLAIIHITFFPFSGSPTPRWISAQTPLIQKMLLIWVRSLLTNAKHYLHAQLGNSQLQYVHTLLNINDQASSLNKWGSVRTMLWVLTSHRRGCHYTYDQQV